MLKGKHMLSAFCMLVAMTMATSAFAQGVFSVSSGVEPRARMNGQTELAGGITLSQENVDADALNGTLTIDYGVPVTNTVADADTPAVNAEDGAGENFIRITGSCFSATTATATAEDSSITVTFTEQACSNGGTIDVSGALLAIAGQGVAGELTANISASGNLRLGSGANRVTVINDIVDELADDGVAVPRGKKAILVRHTGLDEDKMKAAFQFTVTENAVDSFEDTTLLLNFSGIPAGVSIVLDAWQSPAGRVLAPRAQTETEVAEDNPDTQNVVETEHTVINYGSRLDVSLESVTSEKNETEVSMFWTNDPDKMTTETGGGTLSETAVDVIIVNGTIAFDSGPDRKSVLPISVLDIAVTVDVGPLGKADPTATSDYDGVPRFATDPTGPVTVADVDSAQTTLSLPYALSDGTFDTGIAVSNMNTDSEQSGTIMFELYQTGQDMVEWTTPDALDAGGTIALLLSEILLDSGVDTFRGYIVITTDFTGADGLAYISDWAAFSATAALSKD